MTGTTNPRLQLMQTVRLRIIGDVMCAVTLLDMMQDMDGVERAEAMSPSGGAWAPACDIEVDVVDGRAAWRIRSFVAGAALLLDASAKFVEADRPDHHTGGHDTVRSE